MKSLLREQEIARDNFEKGRIEGREEGKEQGIENLIESFKELGINEEIIVQKLIEKYSLSEQKAKNYLR